MVRKYQCDNCGTEIKKLEDVLVVTVNESEFDGVPVCDLGEYCDDCLAHLKEIIKAGFSKGKAQ